MTKLILSFVLGFLVQKRDCDFCHTEHWHSKGACFFVFCFCFCLFIDSVVVLLYSVCVLRLSHITIMVEWTLKVKLFMSLPVFLSLVLKGCVCWYCLGYCCRYFVFLFLFFCLLLLSFLSFFILFFLSFFVPFPFCLFVCLFIYLFIYCYHFLSFFSSFSLKLFMSFSTCTRKLLLYV